MSRRVGVFRYLGTTLTNQNSINNNNNNTIVAAQDQAISTNYFKNKILKEEIEINPLNTELNPICQ